MMQPITHAEKIAIVQMHLSRISAELALAHTDDGKAIIRESAQRIVEVVDAIPSYNVTAEAAE